MYDAATQEELDKAVHLAAAASLDNGGLDCFVADTPERAAAVWSVRGSILEAMKLDSVSQEECDAVVPRHYPRPVCLLFLVWHALFLPAQGL